MRRKDREVCDSSKIEEIIGRCGCCRIGFNDGGEVYIVPMSFGFAADGGRFTFYFHGAKEGRKIDLIGKAPNVGFEMDTGAEVYCHKDPEVACGYTARFQSVIGNGVVSMVSDAEEKIKGLSLIMEHNTGKRDWHFDAKMADSAAVFKLEVTKLSCKEHL